MSSKVFIVTGASRGLGLAISELLLSSSHQVFLVARTEAELQTVKDKFPSSAEYMSADLGDLTVASRIVEAAIKKFGKLDGVVINHGVLSPITRIAQSDVEDWRRAYDINVMSPVALAKEAIPQLRATKGRAIFISSGAASGAYAGWGAYGTAKAAINHLVAHLGVEEPDITSIAVSPGKIDTLMQQEIREMGKTAMAPEIHASFVEEHAGGKLLKPEQPGRVIAKLAVGASKDMSGKHFRWNDSALSGFQGSE